ncbi:MAG: DUF2189 domain-containing protein [Rhodobacterales bacterium]|nr:DUF2189 domain-containing protein [Rhodobacterales bacterium]
MQDSVIEAAAPPGIRQVTRADVLAALGAGWRDFRRASQFGLFFSAVYVAGGWLVFYALTVNGALWWTLPAAAGFPILGPFVAVGLYEVSRRLEAGRPLDWPCVLSVIWRERGRQIPSMAAVVVIFFLFWNFLAHMIFALFLGLEVMTNVSSSLGVFLTPNGLMMLAVGSAVGAVFAGVLFAITVVSLPLLLDREIDFVTGMITSFDTVTENPVVMLGWGATIGVLLFLGMVPGFLGLFVVLPVLGHATWHLYRRALD